MRENDISYSRRRAREEAARALALFDPTVAAVHRRFAEAYRKRAIKLNVTTSAPLPSTP
jgi:hypothetical protein